MQLLVQLKLFARGAKEGGQDCGEGEHQEQSIPALRCTDRAVVQTEAEAAVLLISKRVLDVEPPGVQPHDCVGVIRAIGRKAPGLLHAGALDEDDARNTDTAPGNPRVVELASATVSRHARLSGKAGTIRRLHPNAVADAHDVLKPNPSIS